MSIRTFTKDPDSILDYTIDFSLWLNGDTLSTATWTVQAGLTNVLSTKTNTAALIWLSGGSLATTYSVSVRIVTVGGRTDDRTFSVSIVAK